MTRLIEHFYVVPSKFYTLILIISHKNIFEITYGNLTDLLIIYSPYIIEHNTIVVIIVVC